MNRLSTEEIKKRAEISDEEALNVSIEEWESKCDTIRMGEVARTGGHYCGLCVRAGVLIGNAACSKCILQSASGINCCPEYDAFMKNPSLSNAQAMLNRLYLERGKRYGKDVKKECKKEEPKELRHGDYSSSELYLEKASWIGDDERCEKCFPVHTEGALINVSIRDDFGTILGNIFDDLKRNSKDLEEFEVKTTHGGEKERLQFVLCDDYICCTQISEDKTKLHVHLPFDVFDGLCPKASQMNATAKRKAKKGDC